MADKSKIIGNAGIGDVVSFSLYKDFIGTSFDHVTIKSVIDGETAAELAVDILARHAKIYPSIKDNNVEDDPYSYNYIGVKFENGRTEVIGIPWIKASSVAVHIKRMLTVMIDEPKDTDIDIIRSILSQMNYKIISIGIK